MRVTILTSGLIVLALGALGYPLPRIGDVGSVGMTSGATLDQGPELVRRKYLVPPGPGSPGYGIGVSAGSVDPIPPGSGGPPIQRIRPLNPVTGNPLSVNPPAVVNPAPVNPQPVTPATPPANPNVLPITPPPPSRLSAIQQIRRFDCLRWWHSEALYNAKPPYCDPHNPGGVLGN